MEKYENLIDKKIQVDIKIKNVMGENVHFLIGNKMVAVPISELKLDKYAE